MKENIKVKVVLRVRPFLVQENKESTCLKLSKISNASPITRVTLKSTSTLEEYRYDFDRCYDQNAPLRDLFNREISQHLSSAFEGINTTVFAYGATGTGKTYTMEGSKKNFGIIPRVIKKLFDLGTKMEQDYQLDVSFLEIYNDKAFDLLTDQVNSKMELSIREDMNHNIFVPGLKRMKINDYQDFTTIYAKGCLRRKKGTTLLNPESSRSHCILLIHVTTKKCVGKIHLIDLAGSEDNRRTGNCGLQMQESGKINMSLFVLGKVIMALNDKTVTRVPFRDSKLTRLLQDSLGGTSQAIMICTVAPTIQMFQETYQVLNYASKARQIVNRVTSTHNSEIAGVSRNRRKTIIGTQANSISQQSSHHVATLPLSSSTLPLSSSTLPLSSATCKHKSNTCMLKQPNQNQSNRRKTLMNVQNKENLVPQQQPQHQPQHHHHQQQQQQQQQQQPQQPQPQQPDRQVSVRSSSTTTTTTCNQPSQSLVHHLKDQQKSQQNRRKTILTVREKETNSNLQQSHGLGPFKSQSLPLPSSSVNKNKLRFSKLKQQLSQERQQVSGISQCIGKQGISNTLTLGGTKRKHDSGNLNSRNQINIISQTKKSEKKSNFDAASDALRSPSNKRRIIAMENDSSRNEASISNSLGSLAIHQAKEWIMKAKEKEESGDNHSALEMFREAQVLLPENSKLPHRIKHLEKLIQREKKQELRNLSISFRAEIETSSAEQLITVFNTADRSTLLKLHGIGAKRASRILEIRTETPFENIDDVAKLGLGWKQISSIAALNTLRLGNKSLEQQ